MRMSTSTRPTAAPNSCASRRACGSGAFHSTITPRWRGFGCCCAGKPQQLLAGSCRRRIDQASPHHHSRAGAGGRKRCDIGFYLGGPTTVLSGARRHDITTRRRFMRPAGERPVRTKAGHGKPRRFAFSTPPDAGRTPVSDDELLHRREQPRRTTPIRSALFGYPQLIAARKRYGYVWAKQGYGRKK